MTLPGWHDFLATFVPLFVAMDVIGVLPLYLALTEGLPVTRKHRIIWQALLTASGIGIGFVLVGQGVFRLLGVTVADFQIGGGLILLTFAMLDLLQSEKARRRPSPTMGVVPIGTPLIVGPAVLTTLVMLVDLHGYVITLISLLANLIISSSLLPALCSSNLSKIALPCSR
ncbi:MAG: MarC family protein [Nitrospinota bacterium]|nr:MAG: MarC family protein [Nitrospinota bacterium]